MGYLQYITPDALMDLIKSVFGITTQTPAADVATIKSDVAAIKNDIENLSAMSWISTDNFSGTGTGSAQTITKTGTVIEISNTGLSSLTITVGTVAIIVPSGMTMRYRFAEFTSFTVTATSGQTYSGVIGG